MVALFAVGYAVVQPFMEWLLHVVFGRRLPANTASDWLAYLGVVAGLGVLAGVAWWRTRGLPLGWWRNWLDNVIRALALVAILQGEDFRAMHWASWCRDVIVIACLLGALWVPMAGLLRGTGTSSPSA
jgi:hypothetical protein